MRKVDLTVNRIQDYRTLLLARRAELPPGRPVKFDALAQAGYLPEQDQVMVLHDEFVSMKLTSLARETLKLIGAALERLDSGDYGICVECGEPIPAKRLQAIPWASHCCACQDRIKQDYGSPGLTDRAA